MSLIDEELTREHFDYLDAEVAGRLLTVVNDDLTTLSDQLMAAWAAGDSEAMRLARHSIRGVCSNFGATRLSDLAEADLRSPAQRDAFRALQDATLAAIRRIAGAAVTD